MSLCLSNPHPLPVGIPRIPGTPLHPALSNADLYAILEEEDIANYHRVIAQYPNPQYPFQWLARMRGLRCASPSRGGYSAVRRAGGFAKATPAQEEKRG